MDLEHLVVKIESLNAIGVALSSEPDAERLLQTILEGAKKLTGADAGSLYIRDGDLLRFRMVRNDSIGLAFGGAGHPPPPFAPVRISDHSASVVARAVFSGATVNIADAYDAEGFDFSATRAFDARTGYRSRSFLTVPMRNHEDTVVGALQLINATSDRGEVVPFSEADQRLVESLASQAATALTKGELIAGMAHLFESFIELIATAIDEKSPYTGNHCRRVPELTMALAEAAAAAGLMTLEDSDRYELKIAAWLHDCGKITTPEWVMDKATKLQSINDRIELVATRFEAIHAHIDAACWRAIAAGHDRDRCLAEAALGHQRLRDDLAFLRRVNVGGEMLAPADAQRIRDLAARTWTSDAGTEHRLLSEDEERNLLIAKGTLLPEERQVINNHINATIRMLEKLPFPKHLQRVPEYAGGHHERMDGKGYPRGLTREQMSVPARIMGIADIFEALTAGDRPYKRAMTLSQAVGILGRMAVDGHIDRDLFRIFISSGIHLQYAERFLSAEQRDAVDVDRIPGYR